MIFAILHFYNFILVTDTIVQNNDEISLHFKPMRLIFACFLLGNSPASEFYMLTFRNTLFHLHRQVCAYEDGTDSVPKRRHIKFRRPGELPRRKHTTHRTRRKFEIKKTHFNELQCLASSGSIIYL